MVVVGDVIAGAVQFHDGLAEAFKGCGDDGIREVEIGASGGRAEIGIGEERGISDYAVSGESGIRIGGLEGRSRLRPDLGRFPQ